MRPDRLRGGPRFGREPVVDHRAARRADHDRVLGRDGHPGDVAGAVLYFAASASEFVTGQSLIVDGGQLFG